ncbi:hypothetical protein BGZ75_008121, partial [Mortierella antarctica]
MASEPCSSSISSNNSNNSNNNNSQTPRRRKPSEAAASAAPSNFALLPPSSQFMSAELEEMALLSSANSRTGLVAEVEALKLQLIERDETIHRMTTAERHQEHAQQQQLRTLTDEALVFKRELALLDEARSRLEASLAQSEQERQVQQDRYQQLEQAFEQFKVVGSKDRQQQDDEHWALQETVQRLTAKISDLEDQHASEMQRLQQNHDELLETVVLKHAGALTDLSEQAKTDYEQRLVL